VARAHGPRDLGLGVPVGVRRRSMGAKKKGDADACNHGEYICIYTGTCIYIHICIYAYIYMYSDVENHIVHTCVCVCVCVFACVHMCVYTYMYAYTYIHLIFVVYFFADQ
jgi:hypothetical protein